MALARTFIVVATLVMAAVSPAFAQSSAARYVGRPIEAVRVFIETTPTSEPALLDLIQVRPAERLSMAAVRQSVTHLVSLGRFEDVQVEAADAAGGGVDLRFTLVPVHVVRRVEFTGTLGLSEGDLRRAVTERHGAAPPVGRAGEVARTLLQLYRDNGYLRAAVRALPVDRGGDRADLTFEVDAGPRAIVQSIDVQGEPRIPVPELLRRVRVAVGDPYMRVRLREDLDRYVAQLRKRGFYRASASSRAQESPDQTSVALTIDVEAGPAVSVRFTGDPLPKGRTDDLVPITREASADEDLVEDSEAALEAFLRQDGYWKADVSARSEESDGTLTIVFDIRKGLQYRVADAVAIRGSQAIPADELRALVPIKPDDLYVEANLGEGVARIRELYRRRGFAGVDVKPASNETDPAGPGMGRIQPAIVVVEGARTVIGEVRIEGAQALLEPRLRALIPASVSPGSAYYEPNLADARDKLLGEYLNEGYATASVTPRVLPSEDRTRADVVFTIAEGPQTIVDHILIVGNTHTKPEVILAELQFRPGSPLGLEARFESQRRLTALGLFRRIRISELSHGGETTRDVLITVEEAPATTVGYGGGIEGLQRLRANGEDQFEFAPRGFFDIGRRNLGGRNRTANLYTRVSLRPNDAPDDPARDGTGLGISEYRVVGTYRTPRVFGANDLTITAAAEEGIRSSFNFSRRGTNVDVQRFLTPALRLNGRYSFSTTRTFDERLNEEEQATIDRLFPQVRLSGFSGAISWDTRDSLLTPLSGTFLSAEGATAARSLGGQVGFIKTYLQGFWFRRLPGRRPIVFATRGALGLADGFQREGPPTDDGSPPEIVEDLPASERFFAGGPTTIRGYGLDSVGAPNTISPTGFPTGGNAVLIMNGELRVPVWGDVGAVAFVDGGNVFRRVTEFDFGELRGSVGFGLRYNSPVGPVRVDLGFKLDRRVIGSKLEDRTAIHFSLGQAF